MIKPMVVKVTETEFELDNGNTYPIPFQLDKVPTIPEFQKIYDKWLQIFEQEGIIKPDEQTDKRK